MGIKTIHIKPGFVQGRGARSDAAAGGHTSE